MDKIWQSVKQFINKNKGWLVWVTVIPIVLIGVYRIFVGAVGLGGYKTAKKIIEEKRQELHSKHRKEKQELKDDKCSIKNNNPFRDR